MNHYHKACVVAGRILMKSALQLLRIGHRLVGISPSDQPSREAPQEIEASGKTGAVIQARENGIVKYSGSNERVVKMFLQNEREDRDLMKMMLRKM